MTRFKTGTNSVQEAFFHWDDYFIVCTQQISTGEAHTGFRV